MCQVVNWLQFLLMDKQCSHLYLGMVTKASDYIVHHMIIMKARNLIPKKAIYENWQFVGWLFILF
jgi:hypothetical protein